MSPFHAPPPLLQMTKSQDLNHDICKHHLRKWAPNRFSAPLWRQKFIRCGVGTGARVPKCKRQRNSYLGPGKKSPSTGGGGGAPSAQLEGRCDCGPFSEKCWPASPKLPALQQWAKERGAFWKHHLTTCHSTLHFPAHPYCAHLPILLSELH